MNFSETESHTIAGRMIPLVEAFGIAIKKEAKQPVPEQNLCKNLPAWCHRICDELTSTLFKNIVGFAPQGQLEPRKFGRCMGMLLRGAAFIHKGAGDELKREGLLNLSPKQERKLEEAAGLDVAFRVASKEWETPISDEAELVEAAQAQLKSFTMNLLGPVMGLMKHLANSSVEEQHEFLCGIPEGFIALLNTQGDFSKQGKRHEIFVLLLTLWPEIAEMQNAQPIPTRRDLLAWLEKREGKQLVGDQKQFNELCGDIGLDLAPLDARPSPVRSNCGIRFFPIR